MNPLTDEIRIAGVMTGTSCDGMDLACLSFQPHGWRSRWTRTVNYPSALRKSVLEIQESGSRWSLKEVLDLDHRLGQWYASAIQKVIDDMPDEDRPDVISNHGQTVAHFPKVHGTLQLGEPASIAFKTGISTVSHLRHGDMAAGGEGAPLVPFFHRILANKISSKAPSGTVFQNFGGVGNLTYIGDQGSIIAFDTGPGNYWIDAAVSKITSGKKTFDANGELALKGKPHAPTVKRLLQHPYFKKAPPKSTGRDDFTIDGFYKITRGLKGPDLVATATLATVTSIVRAYDQWIIKQGLPLHHVFVCGGGARNPTLVSWLQNEIGKIKTGVEIVTLDSVGVDPQFIEAQAFAFLGLLTLLGQSVGGNWTGAAENAPPGRITPGKNWAAITPLISRWSSSIPAYLKKSSGP